MSTGSIHHRAKHRSRIRRLALPAALVFGLTLAAQWSNPFAAVLWSPAHAEGPTPTRKKVEPRVVDFTKLAKQKAEARRLMDAARKAAAQGDIETAQRHANQAATIPVEWNLGETSPKKFLEDLQSDLSDPQRFTEPIAEVIKAPIVEVPQKPLRQRRAIEVETPRPTAGRDVIELSFPDDRPGVTETAEEDLSATDEPPTLKFKQEVPSRSANIDAPKSPRMPVLKTSDSAASAPETAAATPRTKQRFAPIPSLEELAEPASVSNSSARQPAEGAAQTSKNSASTTAKHSDSIREAGFREPRQSVVRSSTVRHSGTPSDSLESFSTPQTTEEPQEPTVSRGRVSEMKTSPVTDNRDEKTEADSVEPPTFHQIANDVIPAAPIEDLDSGEPPPRSEIVLPSRRSRTRESSDRSLTTSATEVIAAPVPTPATPTTVVHEIRITDRSAPVDQAANANSASASQFLMNVNSLMMAGLFGALMLLIVVAVTVLPKFGPNPQFTFKVEVNQPNAVVASEPIAKAVAPIAHVAPIAQVVPTVHVEPAAQITPIAPATPAVHIAPITQVAPLAHVAPVAQVAPIYVLKRQMEEAIEHHQEDAMMRQVFDDNLKLREQLDDSRIAA